MGAQETDPRFAETLRHVARVAPDLTVAWAASPAADPFGDLPGRVLLAHADGVVALGAVKRLLSRGRFGACLLRLDGSADQGLWMLSAADYVAKTAGETLTYEIVTGRRSDFVPVADSLDVRAAERRLFAWCIKDTDGVVSRYFNRPISTWISRHLSHFDIQPRHLTAITALLALTTFACLMLGTLPGLIAGCVLYHVTSVIDGLDGEIARAKYMASATGAALDTGVDMASNLLFMIGIASGNAHVYGETYAWMGVFIGATATTAILVMTMVLRFGPGGGSFDVLQLTIERRLASRPSLYRAFTLLHSGFKRDMFALLFAILGLAEVPQAIPWLLAAGTSIWLVAVVVNVPAMLRADRDDILPAHIKAVAKPVAVMAPPRRAPQPALHRHEHPVT